ncbi:hypothetical protein SNEBB_000891 [Seison nebaliae]|nr:hypothetical protein SNEBB_000891 [Seison nebaliae]
MNWVGKFIGPHKLIDRTVEQDKVDDLRKTIDRYITEKYPTKFFPKHVINDENCKRFLLSKNSDYSEGEKKMIAHIDWRIEYGVESIPKKYEATLNKQHNLGKAILLDQRDSSGRPLIYVKSSYHFPTDQTLLDMERFIINLFEQCNALDDGHVDKGSLILDMKDISYANVDYQTLKSLLWLIMEQYPERLYKCFILNPGVLFTIVWKTVRPWMDQYTAAKVIIVKNETEYFTHETMKQLKQLESNKRMVIVRA